MHRKCWRRCEPAAMGIRRIIISCILVLVALHPTSSEVAAAAGTEIRKRSDHWSLQPLKLPPVPTINESAPGQPSAPRHRPQMAGSLMTNPAKLDATNPIDCFIAARLATNGLSLALQADRLTLIRRLSFDLLGLPPSPTEI